MSFLPTPGTGIEPPVTNDEWYPDIDLAALRATCRLDGTVTAERLRSAAVNALLYVNTQLTTWAVTQALAGYTHLANVPASVIDGQPSTVLLYLRAVYAAVQCELIERYRDYDTTAQGDKRADAMDSRLDDAWRDLRWALSDLQGARRVTVELI
jgi:hypothetical protein